MCDNASNNNRMIDKLAGQLVDFPGAPNRTRCFTHILNLVVKSVMCQFNLPSKWKRLHAGTDDSTRNLLDLAGDIEVEDMETAAEQEDLQDESEGYPYENDDRPFDERGEMIMAEIEVLEERVWPVTVVLTKVSK